MKRLAMLLVLLIPSAGPLVVAPFALSRESPPTTDQPTVEPAPIAVKSRVPAWFAADFRRGDDRTVMSRLKATENDARLDLRGQLRRSVREWLAESGIPSGWSSPERLVDSAVREIHVERIDKDYGTLYLAAARVDFSRERFARFAEVYESEVVGRRLAVLAGYIRADEATKGYYTTNLRLAAAAAVGASGVVIYRMLS